MLPLVHRCFSRHSSILRFAIALITETIEPKGLCLWWDCEESKWSCCDWRFLISLSLSVLESLDVDDDESSRCSLRCSISDECILVDCIEIDSVNNIDDIDNNNCILYQYKYIVLIFTLSIILVDYNHVLQPSINIIHNTSLTRLHSCLPHFLLKLSKWHATCYHVREVMLLRNAYPWQSHINHRHGPALLWTEKLDCR